MITTMYIVLTGHDVIWIFRIFFTIGNMICSAMQIISTVHCIGAMVTGISASIPVTLHVVIIISVALISMLHTEVDTDGEVMETEAITTDVLSGVTDME